MTREDVPLMAIGDCTNPFNNGRDSGIFMKIKRTAACSLPDRQPQTRAQCALLAPMKLFPESIVRRDGQFYRQNRAARWPASGWARPWGGFAGRREDGKFLWFFSRE